MDAYAQVVAWEEKAAAALAHRQYEEAVAAHRQAIEAAAALDRPPLVAALYGRLGNALDAAGLIQSAVSAYEAGLRALASQSQSDLQQVIDSMLGIGKGMGYDASWVEVPDLYTETTAADLDEAAEDPALAVKLLINTGNAYLRQQQPDPALNAYEQALARSEIAAAPALRAHALTHVGIIRRRRGQLDAAEAALREAVELLAAQEDRDEERRALAALAGVHRQRGDDDRAVELYRRALTLYERAADLQGEGRVRASLGHLYLLQGRLPEAGQAFERAVELAEFVGDPDTLWHAYWGLGCYRHATGDLDGAAEALQQSLARIRVRHGELRTDEGKVTFLESVQDVYERLLSVHLDRAQAGAQGAAQAALDTAEDARGQALFDLMGVRRRRLQSRERGVRPSRLLPPGVAAQAVSQMSPATPSPLPAFNMASQMAPSTASPGEDPLSGALDEPLWDEDTMSLVDLIELAPGIPSTVPRWPSEAPLPPVSAPPAPVAPLARLVFHVLEERTAVLLATAEGDVHAYASPLGAEALAERVRRLRDALDVDAAPRGMEVQRDAHRRGRRRSREDPLPLLRSLYTDLIAPLADRLPEGDAPLVIEPHGPLWLLPFAALQDADGRWLADRWPLLYAPSAQVLDEIRQEPDYGSPAELDLLAVGNPTMPDLSDRAGVRIRLRPLPGAQRECQAIGELFAGQRVTLLSGDQADWATVVAQMPHHGIIHLATHGIAYAEDPLNSFVALAAPDQAVLDALEERQRSAQGGWLQNRFLYDTIQGDGAKGLLTARQVLYLPLPADLVTLSACQTGLGMVSGEGMIGLSRAFLVAGARAVLVSQWSVSDRATVELMRHFYRLYQAIDDKALALQGAMQALRASAEYAHPRYWAPFVIVGAEA